MNYAMKELERRKNIMEKFADIRKSRTFAPVIRNKHRGVEQW